MPSTSKSQQRFMGMVHAAQQGEPAASPEVAKVAKEISPKAAKEFASTKTKGLPDKKNESVEKLRSMIREMLTESSLSDELYNALKSVKGFHSLGGDAQGRLIVQIENLFRKAGIRY